MKRAATQEEHSQREAQEIIGGDQRNMYRYRAATRTGYKGYKAKRNSDQRNMDKVQHTKAKCTGRRPRESKEYKVTRQTRYKV